MKIFDKENLFAWCIVPYDNLQRTPLQRAEMLKKLGLNKFAYDWRINHLPYLADELKTMRDEKILLQAVWFWIDGGGETLLDQHNELILKTLKEENVKTDLWVSFPERFYLGLTDDEKLNKATNTIKHIYDRAKKVGCTISLYNHGDWFGEPENQIKIIKNLSLDDIGIVYNFHHAHSQMDRFESLLNKILPYLKAVNLNGMEVNGPKILSIGKGDKELEMLRILASSGYNGPLGILGHVESEDAKVVLKRNLDGLNEIKKKLELY